MIISNEHRFIFVHCRKTAGSSISVSLARNLGDDDLQIGAISDTLAQGIPLTRRVLHEANVYCHGTLSLFRLAGPRIFGRAVTRFIDQSYRPLLGRKPPHSPASNVARAFPEEWKNFHKFCVVRNPWDKAVSDYYWRIKSCRNPPTFPAYLEALQEGNSLNGIVPVELHSNWELYTIDDKIAVDCIIRYENLSEGLATLMSDLKLAWDGWLPRSKGNHRKTVRGPDSYREMYNSETLKIISRLYEREIEAFQYTF